MPRTVRDIVLVRPVVNNPPPAAPVLREVVQLVNDITVGPIEAPIVREIAELCDPHKLKRARGDARPPVQYAFCRLLPNDTGVHAFDPDAGLTAAIAMSRLANPTSAAFEWSARVATTDAGAFDEAIPGFIKGRGAHAFIVPGGRDWLTNADAQQTAVLLAAFQAQEQTMQDRVRRALWRHDYAMGIEELDIRWLTVASGLEALVKINYPRVVRGPGSTRQFKMRTVALANAVGVTWTEQDAEQAYELRSDVAHGAKVTGGNNYLPLYAVMETLLRESLKKALLEAPFQALFAADAAVEAAFPA